MLRVASQTHNGRGTVQGYLTVPHPDAPQEHVVVAVVAWDGGGLTAQPIQSLRVEEEPRGVFRSDLKAMDRNPASLVRESIEWLEDAVGDDIIDDRGARLLGVLRFLDADADIDTRELHSRVEALLWDVGSVGVEARIAGREE